MSELSWWLNVILIFLLSGASDCSFLVDSGIGLFNSFEKKSPVDLPVASAIVVGLAQKLPLLILRIIRGESEPESRHLEFVVTSNGCLVELPSGLLDGSILDTVVDGDSTLKDFSVARCISRS